jgi:predicted RNA-binding protein with PIN domain
MPLHIIIDGYNLIRQSASLSAAEAIDLQTGREALIDALAHYKRIKSYRITVVFDGTGRPSLSGDRDRAKGIEIRFSRGGETADTVIKRLVAGERQKTMVVSSDRELCAHAESRGAATISSAAFEDKLAMARYLNAKGMEHETEQRGWKATTRKKGPSKRLTKRKRLNRRRIDKL